MDYTEIVKKLIGNFQPAGATHIDDIRFENLKEMCNLVTELVCEIDKVALQRDKKEYSIKEMADYAYLFLTETLGITE